ncbi:MAG TPA: hypothetical protein VI341_13810 [Actinomycetota bacterium]
MAADLTEPQTAAGRELRDDIQESIDAGGGLHGYRDAILAIEREAATRARSGLDAGLREALRHWLQHGAECGYTSDVTFTGQCECGLEAALASSGEAAPTTSWKYDQRCEVTAEDHELGAACYPLLPHSHRNGTIKWARRFPSGEAAPVDGLRAAAREVVRLFREHPASLAGVHVRALDRLREEADDGR